MNSRNVSKRIEWIDIAKAICILLMIAGHTYSRGSVVRNTIFSFHMPLFFILAGYTFHFEKVDKKSWLQGTWKDFKRLYIPVLIVWLLDYVGKMILYHPDHYLQDRLYALWWASGYESDVPWLGACWFLVSMFWARVCIRTLLLLFDSEKTVYICFVLGVLETIHLKERALPQNFDITFAVMMFMAIGHLWRKHEDFIKKHQYALLLPAAAFWTFCLSNGWYQEFVGRNYVYGMLGAVEAVCGTFLCAGFSDAIASNPVIKKPFLFLGKHTLMLLCIHCLDGFWAKYWNVASSPLIISLTRSLIDIAIMLLILAIEALANRTIEDNVL